MNQRQADLDFSVDNFRQYLQEQPNSDTALDPEGSPGSWLDCWLRAHLKVDQLVISGDWVEVAGN